MVSYLVAPVLGQVRAGTLSLMFTEAAGVYFQRSSSTRDQLAHSLGLAQVSQTIQGHRRAGQHDDGLRTHVNIHPR